MDKKKYKVIYDRFNCIGVGACILLQPEHWLMNRDNKADLIGSIKKEEQTDLIGSFQKQEQFELEFTEDELQKFMQAAENCPVNVIHIIDSHTGKQLI